MNGLHPALKPLILDGIVDKEAVVQHLYLGRRPPMFTDIRVLGESADDDHLVLELGMNFLSADDMSIILAVQPRLGFGIWANMHITGMHVEGKVLVGVKFLRQWPFLGRMRVCFVEPPYFQMTVKPIFNHGVDVTELPGIAGWLDNMLAVAFEQTLVEPNMLVVDVEKFASSPTESWFTVDEKAPIAHAKVEIIEAADLKPSDLNGLADPYVKGHLGSYRFRTKTQKKTLSPKWLEEFNIPITSWEAPNLLVVELRDKDHIFDDMLGDCAINISDLRGGGRHDKWLPLRNIKTGRLHIAITVVDGDSDDQGREQTSEYTGEPPNVNDDSVRKMNETVTSENQDTDEVLTEKSRHMVDEYEPINVEGLEKTGIWVHHPGSEVSQSWEPRKGRERRPETKLQCESHESPDTPRSVGSGSNISDTKSDDNNKKKANRLSAIKKGMHKIGSFFQSNSRDESPRGGDGDELVIPTPRPNLRSVNEKGASVKIVYEDCYDVNEDRDNPEKSEAENSKRGRVKDFAKNMMKKPARSLKSVLSRKGSFSASEDQVSTDAFDENPVESTDSPANSSPGREKEFSESSAKAEENGKVKILQTC